MVTANVCTIGPNLVTSGIQVTATYSSDRLWKRARIAAGAVVISVLAWILLGSLNLVDHPKVGYFFTFLITGFTFILATSSRCGVLPMLPPRRAERSRWG